MKFQASVGEKLMHPQTHALQGCCVANAHKQLVANKLYGGLDHPDKLESYVHRCGCIDGSDAITRCEEVCTDGSLSQPAPTAHVTSLTPAAAVGDVKQLQCADSGSRAAANFLHMPCRSQALAPGASLAQDVRGSWSLVADPFKGVTMLRRCAGV